jgi:hypothetical protein
VAGIADQLHMMRKISYLILIACLVFYTQIFAATTTAGLEKMAIQDASNVKNNRLPPVMLPVLVYNQEFAERFGLDPAQAITLDPGIYAIALDFRRRLFLDVSLDSPFMVHHQLNHITIDQDLALTTVAEYQNKDLTNDYALFPLLFKPDATPVSGYYECGMTIYFKNNDARFENILFPNHELSADYGVRNGALSYFFYPFLKYKKNNELHDEALLEIKKNIDKENRVGNEEDQLLTIYKAYVKLTNSVALISKSAKKYLNAKYIGTGYRSHFVNFLPNITALSVGMGCDAMEDFPAAKGAWLWLEKKTGKKYYQGNVDEEIHFDPNDFYKFQLPSQIVSATSLQRALQSQRASLPPPPSFYTILYELFKW